MKLATEKTAPILVLLGATCWGIIGIFSRPLFAGGFSAMQVTLARISMTAIALLLYLALTDRKKLIIDLRDLPLLFFTGVGCLLLFNFFFFYTLSISTLSIASILQYTAPCFVMILSALFCHEHLTVRKLVSLVIATSGCALTCGLLNGGQAVLTPIALATGLASGFCYGLYSVLSRHLLKKYHPLTMTFYAFSFAALGCLLPGEPGAMLANLAAAPSLIPLLLMMGLGCTLLPFLLYTTGLSHLEASKASVLAIFEPLVATITGALVFHEALTIASGTGVLMILLALTLLNIQGNFRLHRVAVKHNAGL